MLSSVAHDARLAFRSLRRRPGFTLVALVTMALGIGANTAVFSVVNGILLSRLPYREPTRLVTLGSSFISNAELLYLREHLKSFETVATYSPGWGMALTSDGEPMQLTAAKISPDFLPMLGVAPVLGRAFTPEESAPGKGGVVLLDWGLWQSRFGADPGVVGRNISLDGQPFVVVGVMPRDFNFYRSGGGAAQLLVPVTFDPAAWYHRGQNAMAVARLSPGATAEGALAELRAHVPAIREALAYRPEYGRDFLVLPLRDFLVGPVRLMLMIVFSAVGFIMLIATVNVGNLLLVRASERRREVAVRIALGANRWRVVRGLSWESLIIAVGGAVLGLALAVAGVELLRHRLPENTPRLEAISVDGRVLALCAMLGMATALFGVFPALAATRSDPQDALRAGRSGDGAGQAGGRLRGALVATEIAMALVLVIGAGLMLKTLWRLSQVDPGFQPDRAFAFRLQPTGDRLKSGAQTRQYFDQVFAGLRALPGVASVGGIHHLPMSGFNWWADIDVEGRPLAAGEPAPRAAWRIVAGDYMRAMGIPLVAGRGFDTRDDTTSERVALINDVFARRLFPGENPIGRRLNAGNATRREWVRIVGVTGNVRQQSLDLAPDAEMYLPLGQVSMPFLNIVVRASGDPMSLAQAARRVVRQIDPTVPIADLRALDAVVRDSTSRQRLVLQLLVLFAALGLTLGAIGVYGVVAYTVTQRTREIGLRMALGARRESVVRLVLGHGLWYETIGLAVGIVAAVAATRAMRSIVFDVSPTDPATYSVVAVFVLLVAALAGWIPARRAARVDPMVAMRGE
jgi:putative ABC transport system permease protein